VSGYDRFTARKTALGTRTGGLGGPQRRSGKDGDEKYEGNSNENLKSAIKIQKTARLSCKLIIMIVMV
jgi:hypothetical protein